MHYNHIGEVLHHDHRRDSWRGRGCHLGSLAHNHSCWHRSIHMWCGGWLEDCTYRACSHCLQCRLNLHTTCRHCIRTRWGSHCPPHIVGYTSLLHRSAMASSHILQVGWYNLYFLASHKLGLLDTDMKGQN